MSDDREPFRIAIVCEARTAADIEAALEAGAELSKHFDLSAPVPFRPLYDSGIVYQRETPTHGGHNEERFLTRALVDRLGWGDCDDLCIVRVGELRASGVDPYARCKAIESPRRVGFFHIVVERGDGTIEDPSARLGMYNVGGRPAWPRVR